MSRRKVTMLEAFQASARRSVERAAEEQRRLAEERERSARKAAAAKSTQAWRRRLADGVGSIFGSQSEPAAEGPAPEGPAGDPAAAVDVVPGVEQAEPDAASGPPDEGVQPESPGASGDGAPEASQEPPAPPWSRQAPPPAPVSEPAAAPTDAAREPGPPDAAGPMDTLPSSLEEALGTPEGHFIVPISPRVFAAGAALLLATAFLLGMSLGGGAEDDPGGTARAAERRDAASMGAFGATPGARVAAEPRAGGAGPGAAPGTAPAPGAPAGERSAAQGDAAAAPAGLSSADRAFMDPANSVTLLAVTYELTETNKALALATYGVLAEAGFPVVSPVLSADKHRIFLFVGAAETRAQLKTLQRELQAFETPGKGRREFFEAYFVNAADYRP